jgi:hypothetical protein
MGCQCSFGVSEKAWYSHSIISETAYLEADNVVVFVDWPDVAKLYIA